MAAHEVRRGTVGTYRIGTDAYPAVVCDVTPSGKTIWIRTVRSIATADTSVGYGHEAREEIVDPESVDHALNLPAREATYSRIVRLDDTYRDIDQMIANGELTNGEAERLIATADEIFRSEHANAPTKMMLRDGRYAARGGYGSFVAGKAISKRDPHL